MPSEIIHNHCSCGKRKKIVSKICRDCYLFQQKTLKSHTKYKCVDCGKERKKTNSPVCRSCYYKYKDNIINDNTCIGETFYEHSGKNKYNYIRSHARRVIDKLQIPKICACCTFKHCIQVCHIKPISDFPENALFREVNSVDNLIILCPNCHWLFDNGYPSLEELKKLYSST